MKNLEKMKKTKKTKKMKTRNYQSGQECQNIGLIKQDKKLIIKTICTLKYQKKKKKLTLDSVKDLFKRINDLDPKKKLDEKLIKCILILFIMTLIL